MSTRGISGFIARVRNLFNKKPIQPKEPRKKIQLQIKIIEKELKNQVMVLESLLVDPYIQGSTKQLGNILLQNATRFEELQISNINHNRLQTLPHSLISINDFSLWVRHEMINLTEEIFHFISILNES